MTEYSVDICFCVLTSCESMHNHYPLNKDVSLIRTESFTNLWYRDLYLEHSVILSPLSKMLVVGLLLWLMVSPVIGS